MYRKQDDQPRRDPAQEVTDRILEILGTGVKPWMRPWNPDAAAGPQSPFNPTTGKHYRGINVLILGMDARAFMSGDPRWMTYQQAKEKHWQVRKGERATKIFFYKPLEVDNPDAEDGSRTPAYQPPTVEEAPWQRP